jgi:hypothetical protein
VEIKGIRPGRVRENEHAFRRLNAHIHRRRERFLAGDSNAARYVCECSSATCLERLQLTDDEYAAVRSNADHFLIAPGHEESYELVVERLAGFWVVEKSGPRAG